MPHILVQVLFFISYALFNTAAMAVVKETGGQLGAGAHLARLAHLATLRRLVIAGVLYAIAVTILVALLRGGDASSVFPIAIACTVLATNAVGAYYYGEQITLRKIIGTLVLLAGITLTFVDTVPR